MNIWNPWSKTPQRRRGEADDAAKPATIKELSACLRAVDPAAYLVCSRVLRRVIRIDADLHGFAFRVPHSKSYVIQREPLLEIADRSDLGLAENDELPPLVLLLEEPSADELAAGSREEAFLRVWRMLFHASVHRAIHEQKSLGIFSADRVASHVARLGRLTFAEIRAVLQQELFMLPPYDDASAYEEFVAVFLGMRKFNPYLLPSFFPSIEQPEKVEATIGEFLDADALLLATRLPNTPEPRELASTPAALADPYESGSMQTFMEGPDAAPRSRTRRNEATRPRQRSERIYQLWTARADREAARGNLAGAAIRRARAAYVVPRERCGEAATALRNDIHALVERLLKAIGQQDRDPRVWRETLLALASQTPLGIWTPEARTIYDLQKVCVDHERVISTVDVVQWALSWGHRPIVRKLPNQREVLMSRHLRSALARLPVVRISDRQRRQLGEALSEACEEAERGLRRQFRPHIEHALNHIELMPTNVPQSVAREKLVEELLDGIVERGFLTMGDVRDAVSRNNLKQPDCRGPADFIRGNAVLRANRVLALVLDVIYERGDFYLRWIQRFSLLAFGTQIGRAITKYIALPFGGAVVVLVALEHFGSLIARRELVWAPAPTEQMASLTLLQKLQHISQWEPKMPTLVLGIFLFGLINFPQFRALVWEALKAVYRVIKAIFFDLPQWLLAQPWMKAFLQSKVVRLLFRFGLKPLVITAILSLFLPRRSLVSTGMLGPAAIFVGVSLISNTRFGQKIEEVLGDWLTEKLGRFGIWFFIGLFWLIVDLFRSIMHGVERIMYSVDEWLRFKTGQSAMTLVAKGALGVVWFFVAYVLRFTISLLIEPQLNPVKHVPVVTVSHKVVWVAFGKPLIQALSASGYSEWMAGTLTAIILGGIPGIFGFIAWEFKENWRLYAANRPKNLVPVIIGHHGETLARLFKPGFHSGTVPKQFAKLRRAERDALATGDAHTARSHREALHHLEEALRHWADREFVQWFREAQAWHLPPPKLGEIHLATNHTRMHFHFGASAEVELIVTFQITDRRLEAAFTGCLNDLGLANEEQNVLQLAMTSLLKTGGVEAIVLADTSRDDIACKRLDALAETPISWDHWVEQWSETIHTGRNVQCTMYNVQ